MRGAVILLLVCCVDPLQVLTPVPAAHFDSISLGEAHACAVRDGVLYCWGANDGGELGTGDLTAHAAPVRVGHDDDWAQTAVGYGTSCARKTSGAVQCWGDNAHGQCGGDAGIVPLGFAATSVVIHFDHACALSPAHELWCWGFDSEGQLGLGVNNNDFFSPQHVAPGTLWKAVDTAQGHTCGIQMDGSLWCWGRNSQGQLGLPMGSMIQYQSPQHIGTDTDWAKIAATQETSCAIKTDGSLWCWGYLFDADIGGSYPIQYPPLRIGTRTDWEELELETFQICVRDTAKHIWCRGRGFEGQLGAGDFNSRFDAYFDVDGKEWSMGAMGRLFRCAVDLDGGMFCTGTNDYGELGRGVDGGRFSTLQPVRF